MFDKVNAGNERDVVRVEAEDGEALDDGPQLFHALPAQEQNQKMTNIKTPSLLISPCSAPSLPMYKNLPRAGNNSSGSWSSAGPV